MAEPTVADYLLERLRDWGVDKVFAFPGDGINGILAAWGRAGDQPMFIQSRHEEMSAIEAVGYAKFTGRFGVCLATSGPGAIHLLNGLYDAKLVRRQLKFRGGMRGSLSGNLATMGPGVPYGIGAKFGNPDRPVIVFASDGAMQMNGMAELITVKHYWQQWADPRLVIAVLHNNDLNQATWELRAMEGAPKFTKSRWA
jgi:thiamine pyrophosphate-dependent acetolactate synthase large subunit-like protein